MEWYYAKDGKQEGPVSAAQLRQLASAGKLDPTDMIFKIGSKDWVEASTVSGLFPAGRSAPAPAPPDEGGFAFGGESEKVSSTPSRRKGARERVEENEVAEDAPRSHSKLALGSIPFMDYILFQRTIQAWALPIVFWSVVLYVIFQGSRLCYFALTNLKVFGFWGLVDLLLLLIAGAVGLLALRVSFEVMRTLFQIHETLLENKNASERDK